MAAPRLLQAKFLGFKQDSGKDQVPEGYVWDLLDFVPRIGTELRRRGGWSYSGVALNTLNAAATVPNKVAFAPFVSTAGQILAWDNNGLLFDLTNAASRGAGTVPLHTPVFFRDLCLWADGSNPAKRYDGAAIASIGGSPPSTPRCAAVWKERLLLSGRSSTPAEHASIYFSAPGNAESWDTTNAIVQTSQPIIGLASLRGQLVCFHSGSVERIRGTTPPSSTGVGDLVLEPLFDNVGIFEPNSFAVQDDLVVWADENGLYSSDGASLTDLTAKGGIKQYWQQLFDSATVTNLAVGAWRGFALVSLTTASAYVDFLVCHLESRSFFRFSNIRANNFSARPGAVDAFYFSNRVTKQVGNLATSFLPKAGTKADPSGIADMTPTLWTPYYMLGSQGKKRTKYVYLSYELLDAGTDDPTLTVAFALTPETATYTSLTPTFPETTTRDRQRVALARASAGVALKITQTGPSEDTRIYALETDAYAQEGSRL